MVTILRDPVERALSEYFFFHAPDACYFFGKRTKAFPLKVRFARGGSHHCDSHCLAHSISTRHLTAFSGHVNRPCRYCRHYRLSWQRCRRM